MGMQYMCEGLNQASALQSLNLSGILLPLFAVRCFIGHKSIRK